MLSYIAISLKAQNFIFGKEADVESQDVLSLLESNFLTIFFPIIDIFCILNFLDIGIFWLAGWH